MAKRNKSSASLIPDLGRHTLVFDKDDIVRLLRAAVEREGSPAFAKRHGDDRVVVNMILNGKRSLSGPIAKALGLRKVYIAE